MNILCPNCKDNTIIEVNWSLDHLTCTHCGYTALRKLIVEDPNKILIGEDDDDD